jgi:hypothetical protein
MQTKRANAKSEVPLPQEFVSCFFSKFGWELVVNLVLQFQAKSSLSLAYFLASSMIKLVRWLGANGHRGEGRVRPSPYSFSKLALMVLTIRLPVTQRLV